MASGYVSSKICRICCTRSPEAAFFATLDNIPARYPLSLLLLALLAYGAAAAGTFHLDDASLFVDPNVTSPAGIVQLWAPLATRPLTYSTFWLTYQLAGAHPLPYLITSLALHLAIVWLLFDSLHRALPRNAAWLAAALFAVHPIQAEAVNYIFERATLLAALFCLLSLRAWLGNAPWLAAAWFVPALLAKEESVAFPLFLALLSFAGKGPKRAWTQLASMLTLAAAAGIRTLVAASLAAGTSAGASAAYSPGKYLATQGPVIWRYVRLLVLPSGFTVDPDIRVATPALAAAAWLALTAAASLALFAALHGWQPGWWLLGGLILLLPSSSIFPASDLAADRRMYLPMIAFSAAIGLLAQRLDWRIGAALAALLAGLALHRTLLWHSNRTLWQDAVNQAPAKLRPRIQLARALPPAQAISLLNETHTLFPDDPRVPAELGRIYLAQGDAPHALAAFGQALAGSPAEPLAYNNRGAALAALGQNEAARADFLRALALNPCEFNALLNLRRLGDPHPLPPHCRFTPLELHQLEGY